MGSLEYVKVLGLERVFLLGGWGEDIVVCAFENSLYDRERERERV